MELNNNLNYAVISNKINNDLLKQYEEYRIIEKIDFNKLKEIIYNYPEKMIVFNDCLRKFKIKEKETIIDMLRSRKVNFINITSNIEEVLYSDYLYVYYDGKIAIEGKTLEVLKMEKLKFNRTLEKGLGFALPFTVDMSIQLQLYNLINDTFVDNRKLVDELWK